MDMGYLTLTRRIKDGAMDSNAEGIGWKRLPDSKVSFLCLQMQGTCEVRMFIRTYCYAHDAHVHINYSHLELE